MSDEIVDSKPHSTFTWLIYFGEKLLKYFEFCINMHKKIYKNTSNLYLSNRERI